MTTVAIPEIEQALSDLAHDLRQPLSIIQYSSCYLRILLSEAGEGVQEQLRLIERQVEAASRILEEASERSRT